MRPSHISRALSAIIPTRQSVLLLGPPGLGKSSIAYQAGAQHFNGEDCHSTVSGLPDAPWLVVIRATDRDPVDLRGLPYVKDGQTRWSKPDLIADLRPEGGIILIEELPQALPAVQCVLRELLLDHRIGGHKIPDTWSVVATGNRAQDRAGSAKLLTHVASSVVVMEMESSHEDWQSWALQRGIAADVRSYINFKPASLHDFDPARLVNTDPRGWERVSILSKAVPEDLMLSVISGCVCQGHAAEYMAFRELALKLPDPKKLLEDPEKGKVPTEPSVLYALSGALVEVVREHRDNKKLLGNFVRYCLRIGQEAPQGQVYSVLTMRDAITVEKKLLNVAEEKGWLKQYKDALKGNV